jgi:hypothetical protein
MPHFKNIAIIFSLTLLLLISTKTNSTPVKNEDPNNTLNHPVTLNLLVKKKNNTSKRLILPIVQIGSKRFKLNTTFDTGSQGLVLNASRVLPAEMITQDGITMNGQSSITINGIRITDIQDSCAYGAIKEKKRRYFGQIAYATVTLGDESNNVTTREMPFLLVYKGIVIFTQQPAKVDPVNDGICGVLSSYVSNDDNATSRKQLKSPFDYVSYSGDLNAGIELDPINDYIYGNVKDGMYPVPMLKIGITDRMESGLHIYEQKRLKNGSYSSTATTDVQCNGLAIKTNVLFDTGTPGCTYLYNPAFTSVSDVQPGTEMQFNLKDFSYKYYVDARHKTVSGPGNRTILPLVFFNDHHYLLDYQNHLICFL